MVQQIRVLQQLTQWTMGNPDRIRERMEEQKDTEQTFWVWPSLYAHSEQANVYQIED
jgi:hypothetical protein